MRGLWRIVFLFTFVLVWSGLSMASGSVKIDSVLLLDTSGSMSTTDASNRRMAAIHLFISLLGDKDRLAIISFDSTARLLSTFRPLHSIEKENLEKLITGMGQPSGAFTNLYDPVEMALELLVKEKRPDALPVVIMLTDGKMDVGNAAQNKHLVDDLLNKVMPSYRKDHVQFFSLAFGGYDMSLLEALSDQTGGEVWTTKQTLDLKKLFGELFLAIKEPQILTVDSGRFRVDTDTHELTVLKDSPAGQVVGLRSPSGQEYSGEGANFIRINNPEAGEWSVKEAQDVPEVYVLPGMGLNVGLPENLIETDPPRRIEAWLDKNRGSALKDPAILGSLRIWLDINSLDETGQTPVTLELNDKGINDDMNAQDGIFSGLLPHLKAGTYQVKTHADNGTLKLNKSLIFEVKSKSAESPAPPEGLPEPVPEPDASKALSTDSAESKQAMKIILVVNLILLMIGGGLYFVLRHRRRKNPD
jgi:uncharacterized protein YegL